MNEHVEREQEIPHVNVIGPVLTVINELVEHRLLIDYGIDGGIAVLYYTEPVLTYDFDILCVFPPSGTLLDPTPVFEYLKNKGYGFGKEDRVNIEGVPVQFIPVSEGLVEEAVQHTVDLTISEVRTKILAVEYLIAMMLY